jgi:C4-dicarboxylate-specific signal transduction histidine kinase
LESTRRERQYRQMQSELAHANRVAPMGQLTASIAREIKQPIAAARNNAPALNFLEKSPLDVAEVREALTCIVNDADRAGGVVDRIGSLIKKAPPRKEVVDLNAAILEVTALTHGKAVKTGVTVDAQLAGELPSIQCDRVQLQQGMLNLPAQVRRQAFSRSCSRTRARQGCVVEAQPDCRQHTRARRSCETKRGRIRRFRSVAASQARA